MQVFERFLLGETLEECYDAVAEVANRWLDMLDTQVGVRRHLSSQMPAVLPLYIELCCQQCTLSVESVTLAYQVLRHVSCYAVK